MIGFHSAQTAPKPGGRGSRRAATWLAIVTLMAALIPPPPLHAEETPLPWLKTLAQAYRVSQQTRKPILVRFGARSCPHCKKLAAEINKPDVQTQIADWTLVSIDVDESPGDAQLLGVARVPALRLLTPTGKLTASRDGSMTADELITWLGEHREKASAVPAKELTDEAPLTLISAMRLVREFSQRDATLREAAVQRLLPDPKIAALPVVAAFADGSLSIRLTALELLEEWKAPVKGLDPWQPESLSEDRLKTLSEWASSPDRAQEPNSKTNETLTEQELAEARQMMAKMIVAEPVESQAIRERLSRYGKLLSSEIYRQLKQAETDVTRERLTALRYRLAAPKNLVLNWPGGIERLAATDGKTRHQAADELAKRATPAEEPLLLELFSDPSPLVREISLRALREVGGTRADSALIQLLDDPEPNVRAAVLKQLSESPSKRLVPQIAKYVAAEKDPDLVVHAVRLLRETGGKEAIECLMTLFDHQSWRVRAESAEAVGKATGGSYSRRSFGSNSNNESKVDAYVALIRLLDDKDSFVVSRAVTALSKADLVVVVDPLAKAIIYLAHHA